MPLNQQGNLLELLTVSQAADADLAQVQRRHHGNTEGAFWDVIPPVGHSHAKRTLRTRGPTLVTLQPLLADLWIQIQVSCTCCTGVYLTV